MTRNLKEAVLMGSGEFSAQEWLEKTDPKRVAREADKTRLSEANLFHSAQKSVTRLSDNQRENISDGYHTFKELYDHRIEIYIALCRQMQKLLPSRVWRTRIHSDGTSFEGWFVLGIGYDKGEQITYHLPISRWGDCAFAEDLCEAPEFDGHTSADVLVRLKNL